MGFLVGTTFEATMFGLLAWMDGMNDYAFMLASLTLCVMGYLSTVHHVVLHHMDQLLSAIIAPEQRIAADDRIQIYGQFNAGVFLGMALECFVLQTVLGKTSSVDMSSHVLGIMSILFGIGCATLSLVRAYCFPPTVAFASKATLLHDYSEPFFTSCMV